MSIDDTTDVVVQTLLMLAEGAANADLYGATSANVVERAFGWPAKPSLVGQQALPMLTLYRQSGTARDTGYYDDTDTTQFRIEYFAPATPLERIPERWPLLRHVWVSVRAALRNGRHTKVCKGAELFSQAGLTYQLGVDNVVYGLDPSTDGNGVYPHFMGTVTIEECAPETGAALCAADIDGLPDFLLMQSEFCVGGEATPIITDWTNLTPAPDVPANALLSPMADLLTDPSGDTLLEPN